MDIGTEDRNGIFKFFSEICAIPHGSGNEKQISDYLSDFAKKRGLWVRQDSELNVIIKKNATPGYETAKPVIIQAHMDMVCEKNNDTTHDFRKDGIQTVATGDYIKALDTTLGADNGIGVAYALALLDSNDIKHPPLEIMLTTNEETGMDGAKSIDSSLFEGRRLINLDNEDEGICFVSCAGGRRCDVSISNRYERSPEGGKAYQISIGGLTGGHSGMAIHLQRGNAIRLLARLLSELDGDFDFNLASICGGSKENAIPREASCVVVLNENREREFLDRIASVENVFKAEIRHADPGLLISTANWQKPSQVMTKECAWEIITIGIMLPNGALTYTADIAGLVESSANIGVLGIAGQHQDEKTVYCCSLRSSVSSLKSFYAAQIKTLSGLIGAEYGDRGDYPAWEYAADSPLRELYAKTYRELFNKEIKISALHAGLECGVFADKFPGVDMISVGPNMSGVHAPGEQLSISSTFRVWELLKAVLANMR